MKKILSFVLAVCMIASLCVFTASAAATPTMKLKIVENEKNVVVTVAVIGTAVELNNINLYMTYDNTNLEYVGISNVNASVALFDKGSEAVDKTTYVSYSSVTVDDAKFITLADGEELNAFDLTFTKTGTVSADSFAIEKQGSGRQTFIPSVYANDIKYALNATSNALIIDKSFTPYSAPVEDKVVTFNKVYSEGTTAVVFGKALEGATEAGVYFAKDGAALEHSTAMENTTKGAGYFPAYTSDITKAFGVQIQDLEAGSYAAKVYSDDEFGDEVSFEIK